MSSNDSARSSTFSRSEEDDSDDSGVIKDVTKHVTEDDKDNNDAEHSVKSKPNDIHSNKNFSVGDLVWARTAHSTYYPCVVTADPHYKFHTKIVKSDPGHQGGGVSPDTEQRQYHVQYLGENKRLWLQQNFIIPYSGVEQYEKLAMEDLPNIHKIYKPKSEAAKTAWREAVQIAQEMEDMSAGERVARCDRARIMERGGDKALQKKLEMEKHRKSESDRSPEKFKQPSSPRKSLDSEDKKKTPQYNRKDELQYKMNRISEFERKKRKSDENKKVEEGKHPLPFNVFEKAAAPIFDRSFKIKTIPKVKEETNVPDLTDEKEQINEDKLNGSSADDESTDDLNGPVTNDNESSSMTTIVTDEEMTEGSLVWAKQRVRLSKNNFVLLTHYPILGISLLASCDCKRPEGWRIC